MESELLKLINKNNSGQVLNKEELLLARKLIKEPEYSDSYCWMCSADFIFNRAIYDTMLCQEHALGALDYRR